MNPDTGHLITTEPKDWSKLIEEKNYVPVPKRLKQEASKELGGKSETYVDLKADTPLAKFAKEQREYKNRQVRRAEERAATKSRR